MQFLGTQLPQGYSLICEMQGYLRTVGRPKQTGVSKDKSRDILRGHGSALLCSRKLQNLLIALLNLHLLRQTFLLQERMRCL